ncbi:hypothetical protein JCM9743_03610 [Natrinema sp. JCM 9743]
MRGGYACGFDDARVEAVGPTDTRIVTAQRRVFLSGGNILLNLNLLIPNVAESDGTRDREAPVKSHLCVTCTVVTRWCSNRATVDGFSVLSSVDAGYSRHCRRLEDGQRSVANVSPASRAASRQSAA